MVCEDAFGVITIVNNVVSMMNELKGKIMADFYYIQMDTPLIHFKNMEEVR
ncbi:MAG: hypothetical protein K0S67_129 [Nitrososphaeraceae archaeon]|jgi:hypothetical protein|nr:hypothetical protein [Nitrososphaeraceae archaeon]MCD6036245.1 hypothetical protein [Nitrososphaeraceae archaeon]MDF2767654.1 hypothetical protein [Nitrososphaeraceae archaeon]